MTYLSDADHAATVEVLFLARDLLDVAPSPFTGEITRDEITYDLCIRCDVWPESSRVRDDNARLDITPVTC